MDRSWSKHPHPRYHVSVPFAPAGFHWQLWCVSSDWIFQTLPASYRQEKSDIQPMFSLPDSNRYKRSPVRFFQVPYHLPRYHPYYNKLTSLAIGILLPDMGEALHLHLQGSSSLSVRVNGYHWQASDTILLFQSCVFSVRNHQDIVPLSLASQYCHPQQPFHSQRSRISFSNDYSAPVNQ